MLTIGERIRARRKQVGLTLGALAHELAVFDDELSAIEHDERLVTRDEIAILGIVLGIDVPRFTSQVELVIAYERLQRRNEPRSFEGVSGAATDPFLAHHRAYTTRSRKNIEQIAIDMRLSLPVPRRGLNSAVHTPLPNIDS